MNSTFSKNTESILTELLKKSEQYQNLFKNANDAILVIEPENETVLNVNDKACEIYGFEFEDFVGLSLKSISKDVEYGDEKRKKLLEIGTCQEFETIQFRADGTPLHLHVNAAVIEYEGQPAILSINRDITVRIQTEQALQEREQFLLSVANAAQDAIVSTDNHGNIIFWNEGARKIFGYDAEEVIGKSSGILMPERFRGLYAGGIQRFKETGELRIIGKTVERLGQRKDGSEFPVELSLGVWETINGKCFTGIIRDISERRKAEQIKMFRVLEVALRSEIGLKFAGSNESLKTKLTHCVESIFTHLDAAFVQIWTFNEEENVLELQADAGICTHIDKLPARVPVGQFKIGLIAQEQKPHITNDVFIDVFPGDNAWARQNELTSFAGHPLITNGRLIGVVAIFARHELPEETLDALASVSYIITQNIERMRAEKALEEAAKRERAMVENALDVICTIDAEGRFVAINPACFKMWGYHPEELLGRQYIDLVAPEDVAKTNEAALSIMSGTEATNFVNRYQHKNGTLVYTMWTSYWSESEQSLFAVAHNITERKLLEEQKSAILDALPAHICLLDPSGNILEVNNEWKQFALENGYDDINFGIGSNYIKTCEDATGEFAEGAKEVADVCRAVLSGESSHFEMEYPCHSPNEKRWFKLSVTPLHKGKSAGAVVMHINTTERRQTEENLQESEMRYRGLFESNPNPIGVYDADTLELLAVNEEAVRHYGYSREEFLKLTINELRAPEHPSVLKEQIRQAAAGIVKFSSVKHLKKDGTIIEVEVVLQSINFGGRRAKFAMITDVTERKQAESNLLKSEANLAAAQRIAHLGSWEIELSDLKRINNNKVRWSDEVYRIFGYEPGQMDVSINHYFNAVHPNDRKQVRRAFMEAVSYRKDLNIEYRVVLPDGSERLQHGQGEVIYNEQSHQLLKFIGTVQDVTEQKRAANSLQKNLSLLSSMFEATADGILVLNRDNKIKTFNEKFVEMWSIPEDIAHEKSTLQITTFVSEQLKDSENAKKRFEKSLEEPEATQFHVLELNDGRFYERYSIPQMLGGKVIGRVLSYRDITERKKAEAKLQESEERFRSFMNNNPAIAFMKDETGRMVFCNETMERTFSMQAGNLLGKADSEWLPEDICEQVRLNDQKVLASNQTIQAIESIPTPDGEMRRWLSFKFPVDDASGGKFIGCVAIDITERERAEAALRESEYTLRTLLTSMNEGLLQVDEEDCIVFANRCFGEMVGYSQEELIGKNWSPLLLDNEGNEFIREVNKRRREGISDKYELCLRKKTGEMIYVMVGGVPILDIEGVVTGSMGVFTDITERKLIEKQLLHDAFHDGLTGLANRALFMDHLRLTIERGRSRNSNLYAVLFLDFDRFKVINDSLSHTEGDNLLNFIARRLESSTRTGDLVARLGGDEFVVLLNELVEEGDAVQIAERIQASMKNPFNLNGNEIFISASIGIALSASGHKRPEDMLRDADIAMYRAKAKGKARCQIFDPAMHEHASKQLQLETEMRRALENRDFQIHYQPIMNLKNETLMGFEALVRWKHAERGMIPPFEFIPTAEESGLILPLGKWILEESCRQLRRWQDNNPAAANLSVSVNLSTKQFSQPDLAGQVAAALAATGLDPRCLKLEITESHIMENSETAVIVMEKLRALGVELSLDDFGTGYSSLSYLHRLPVNYLKIDRSFVTRMIDSKENSEIVLTIIKLAQNLKMKVIAEGIETKEQLAHLKNLNCECGQGYFFAKPLEPDNAETYIGKNAEKFACLSDAQIINAELNM